MTSKKEEREVDLLAISLVSVLITLEDYHCSIYFACIPSHTPRSHVSLFALAIGNNNYIRSCGVCSLLGKKWP